MPVLGTRGRRISEHQRPALSCKVSSTYGDTASKMQNKVCICFSILSSCFIDTAAWFHPDRDDSPEKLQGLH